MSTNLVIVESPAKAKTIKKYLGRGYKVLASYGHVRDLIQKSGAVDTDNNFAMQYAPIERNQKHVNAIAKALADADALYLATDPDREGEAIAWHLVELLKEKKKLKNKAVYRVVFYEITKKAVREAIENPQEIHGELVDAQQARRALDYLVGFNLSPLLWKKIRPRLSAGRVQSPALRMIVEREDEIEKFVSKEYWTIEASIEKDEKVFAAHLAQYNGDKVEQFSFTDEKQTMAAIESINTAADGKLTVTKVEKSERKRNPAPPFITSTLQQEAARKLGFSARRTMRAAQRLYEGVNTGEGEVGLITYMRTDSVTLANDAVSEIRELIGERYGKENFPDAPRAYKSKSKNAQEAHEAIRPTSSARLPSTIKEHLEPDQYRLYNLIWQRTVACQMVPAIFDTVRADLSPAGREEKDRFRANGSVLKKPGFMAVYKEDQDDKPADDRDRILPEMTAGDRIKLLDILPDQHFTEPPPRYTEASLVKALEEHGIGRPSTYASIISTLRDREYVEMDGRRFIPTAIGKIVAHFLTKHFDTYVDYGFTAELEDELDEISRGEREWIPVLEQFWDPFIKRVEEKEETVTRDEAAMTRELGTDPKTGKPVRVKMGRYGPYVQIGSREDEEKPQFAGLRPGQNMDKITYDEAMKLFELPRDLGETPEGEPMLTNYGRFGPYVKYGDKYVSIKDEDPHTITVEKALELVAAKKKADAEKLIQDFPDAEIQVLNGRYGPYVTGKVGGKKINAKVPKDEEPKRLSLERCQQLLQERAEAGPGWGRKKKTTKKKAAKKKAKKKTKKKTTKKKTKRKSAAKQTTTKKIKKKPAAKKTAKKRKTTSKKT